MKEISNLQECLVHKQKKGNPQIDIDKERKVQAAVLSAIEAEIINSAHDCSEGGLAVTLAESSITNAGNMLGAVVKLDGIKDKGVWVKWMELRIHGDVQAINTPTGLIPIYEDLKRLFQEVLGKEYTNEQYVEQFAIRIPQSLQKIERIENVYRTEVSDTPQVLFDVLTKQRDSLLAAQKKYGDCVAPSEFA